MATDGSQKLDWNGQAFPHLPSWLRPKAPDSYAAASSTHHQSQSQHQDHHQQQQETLDRTGTWNGPAPRGYSTQPTHAADAAANQTNTTQTKQPDCVTLPGGDKMPLIGLGTYKLESAEVVKTALQAGYRHFDCASIYGTEPLVGQGLKEYLHADKDRRASLFITSKIWNTDHHPDAVEASVKKSIEDLGCEYLDLVLIHWPQAWIPGTQGDIDTGVTMQETWSALEALVDGGFIRHLGLSNFGLSQVEDMLSWCKKKPVVHQFETHPLCALRKMVGVCNRKGVYCVAHSPLGHSTLALLEHPEVVKVAHQVNKTPAQVLLKWNVQRGVAVLPKANSEAHCRENIDGLFDWRLTWDQKVVLDGIDEGKRMAVPPWPWRWDDFEGGGAVKPSTVLLS